MQEEWPREQPTLAEMIAKLNDLPPEQAEDIARRITPASLKPPVVIGPVPEPVYSSWDDFVARTEPSEIYAWCARKAKSANRERLMSGAPMVKLSGREVRAILFKAQGRCVHCGSLAVERRPSKPNGAPAPWERVGRRIGSLGHLNARFNGGDNHADNLVWSCLWCNTWTNERTWHADNHGGIY